MCCILYHNVPCHRAMIPQETVSLRNGVSNRDQSDSDIFTTHPLNLLLMVRVQQIIYQRI